MGLFNSIRLGSSAAGDYEIERSLRFNTSDVAYLNRTIGTPTNNKIFTFSCWLKISKLDGDGKSIFLAQGSGQSGADQILTLKDDNKLFFQGSDSGIYGRWESTRLLRDTSAWYHIVVKVDTTASSNGVTFYVNNEVAAGTWVTTLAQDQTFSGSANGATQQVGKGLSSWPSQQAFGGYLAEVNFVDGQALNPSSFAETNSDTGQWIPKKYIGSYGTNGFYLNFSDNSGTTATTLGKDSSGNGNNFTPNNFSVSAGTGNDSLEDTPTNNFSTINPLAGYSTTFETPANGNLDFSLANSEFAFSTFEIPTSGKWYAEVVFTTFASGRCGITNLATKNANKWHGIDHMGGAIRVDDSQVQGSLSPTIGNNKIVGIKVDRDAGTIAFTVDGSDSGTAVNISSMSSPENLVFAVGRNSSSGSAPAGSINFGQRAFSHLPTDYKSLCSTNLTDPSILLPNQHFEALPYTTSGSTLSITGLQFDPDFVWLKNRSIAYSPEVYDIVRGNNKRVFPDSSNVENTSGALSFGVTGGYSIVNSAPINDSGIDNIATWNWKGGGSASSNGDGSITSSVSANTTAGFSIVTYTGTGSDATVGHGLGVAPKVVNVKCRDGAHSWRMYFSGVTDTDGKYLSLDSTIALTSGSDKWNGAPTSSVFGVSGDNSTGGSLDYVAYCFSEVAGYSKFGTYTGNGNADGTFVYLGFRPAFVIIKRTDGAENWWLYDNKRDPDNPMTQILYGDLNNVEISATGNNVSNDFLSNGIKFITTNGNWNGNGMTYIYMAFAESPFKYSRAR